MASWLAGTYRLVMAESYAAIQAAADALMAEIMQAEQDVIADFGEEIIEAGAWVEIVRSVLLMSGASETVKREVLRRSGLEWIEGY